MSGLLLPKPIQNRSKINPKSIQNQLKNSNGIKETGLFCNSVYVTHPLCKLFYKTNYLL